MKIIEEPGMNWAMMPKLPADYPLTTFDEATAIYTDKSDQDVYAVDIKRDWAVGNTAHGGYLMSLVARAVQSHFQIKHANLNQPDLVTFHVEFISSPSLRPATVQIHELKLGRRFSLVRAQLIQDSSKQKGRICLEALITQGNLSQEAAGGGVTLPTPPILSLPAVPPREGFEQWHGVPEWRATRPIAFKTDAFLPKGSDSLAGNPTHGPSVREQWLRFADGVGTGFTTASLPVLADTYRPLPEAYGLTNTAFPTLSYGLEIRRAPPTPQGWPWLYTRLEMREAKHGRYDMDLIILDEAGQIVALGKHTALIVPIGPAFKPAPKAVQVSSKL